LRRDRERELQRIHEQIDQRGYALTTDYDLGFEPDIRDHINTQFFNEDVLQTDFPGVLPPDRLRGRDMIRYWRAPGGLSLEENDTATIQTPEGLAGNHPHGQKRDYRRTEILDDSGFKALAATFLELPPEAEWQPSGTMGVNLFRTFTSVVSGQHQDGEQFVVIYVVGKDGSGATTSLHPVEAREQTAAAPTLQPGQLMIFRDASFYHSATPLTPATGDNQARRDAIICTIDYPRAQP